MLHIEIEHYQLTATLEWVWDVRWNDAFAIRRWLVAALFVAWRRSAVLDVRASEAGERQGGAVNSHQATREPDGKNV